VAGWQMAQHAISEISALSEKGSDSVRPPESDAHVPLVVDLDGTLVKTDLLVECLVSLLKDWPRYLFALPSWLLLGKAAFKQRIAHRVSFDPRLIPYRSEFVEYLKKKRAHGRSIVLATGNDERLAQHVADHLKLFDSILASDGSVNLSGERKRERLVSRFGEKGFDYAANAKCDMVVWSSARKAVVVNQSPQFAKAVGKVTKVEDTFEGRRAGWTDYLSALRPRHWLKNLLVFVPLVATHGFHQVTLLEKTLTAFIAFCCCASSGYLFNDAVDLSVDRRHPQKRMRPFAAGRLPLRDALIMIPALVVLGCALSLSVSRLFLGVVLLYYALTLTYSLRIKRIVLLDVIVLAGLYTLRIVAGSAAIAVWPSEWILAFSPFLFLSLAFVKRYSELVILRNSDGNQARARDYEVSDAELLATNGTVSGYVAVLVLALYITSRTAKVSYGRHDLLWFLCPLLLYWLTHIWLVAHRGRMLEEPLVFALRDWTSRLLIVLMMVTALLAAA